MLRAGSAEVQRVPPVGRAGRQLLDLDIIQTLMERISQRWHFGLLKHPAVKRFRDRELDLRIVVCDQFPSQKVSRSFMSRGSPNLSNNSAIRTISILIGV